MNHNRCPHCGEDICETMDFQPKKLPDGTYDPLIANTSITCWQCKQKIVHVYKLIAEVVVP